MQTKVGHGHVFNAASILEATTPYKVNNKRPVMVCENAAKHDHLCAMCIYCYNKMQSNEAKPS